MPSSGEYEKISPLEGRRTATIFDGISGLEIQKQPANPVMMPVSFLDAVSVGVIQMSLMQESVLDRLWTKYEHRFGHPPPIASASFEEAISEIRLALNRREAGQAASYRHNEISNTGGMPIQAP